MIVEKNQVGEVPDYSPIFKMPLLGEPAAPFKAETTMGPIDFPFDYKGKWVVFFSHPGDFQPVCTSEFMYFQKMQEEFKKINTELLGLSVDSILSHLAWIKSIYDIEWNDMKDTIINFPVVADPTMTVANRYGMVHRGESESKTVRALFVIDPNSIVRNILYYSNITGRNLDEVLRVVKALQTADAENVATPANWEPGEPVIIPVPETMQGLEARQKGLLKNPNATCVSWYMCFKNVEINSLFSKPRNNNKF